MMNDKKNFFLEAVLELVPESEFILIGNTYSGLDWKDERPQPTEEEINTKIQELEAAEPMRLLRLERDRRIALTDWRFRSDLTPKQEWYEYCQALRDLPSTAEPMLDENGNLTNVTWPEEPVE